MVSISRSAQVAAPAHEVWGVVGNFGELDAWHPWVPNCTLSEDGLTRTIDLGSTAAVEVLDPSSITDLSHSYRVDRSPLPIKNYTAIWSNEYAGGGNAMYPQDGACSPPMNNTDRYVVEFASAKTIGTCPSCAAQPPPLHPPL